MFEPLRATAYGPNGSMDPALGYSPGANTAHVGEATFGPHGSQDPAQGYVPGISITQRACDQTLMVRAFDRSTATWSNMLDIDLACGG